MATTPREILRSCGFFRSLSDASIAKIEPIARIVRFAKGRTIFRQGDPCPGIYVVGEGAVRVYKLAPSGKEHVLHFAYAGMTFAEVASIGKFKCPAFADAMEPTVCALLPQREFLSILDGDHAFCRELMSGMSTWIKQLVGLLEDIVLRDAVSRVARHLIQADPTRGEGEFTLPMRKKALASHLNLTSEALSRTLRRLAELNLIEMRDAQHIHISSFEALSDVAQGLPPAEFD